MLLTHFSLGALTTSLIHASVISIEPRSGADGNSTLVQRDSGLEVVTPYPAGGQVGAVYVCEKANFKGTCMWITVDVTSKNDSACITPQYYLQNPQNFLFPKSMVPFKGTHCDLWWGEGCNTEQSLHTGTLVYPGLVKLGNQDHLRGILGTGRLIGEVGQVGVWFKRMQCYRPDNLDEICRKYEWQDNLRNMAGKRRFSCVDICEQGLVADWEGLDNTHDSANCVAKN